MTGDSHLTYPQRKSNGDTLRKINTSKSHTPCPRAHQVSDGTSITRVFAKLGNALPPFPCSIRGLACGINLPQHIMRKIRFFMPFNTTWSRKLRFGLPGSYTLIPGTKWINGQYPKHGLEFAICARLASSTPSVSDACPHARSRRSPRTSAPRVRPTSPARTQATLRACERRASCKWTSYAP